MNIIGILALVVKIGGWSLRFLYSRHLREALSRSGPAGGPLIVGIIPRKNLITIRDRTRRIGLGLTVVVFNTLLLGADGGKLSLILSVWPLNRLRGVTHRLGKIVRFLV